MGGGCIGGLIMSAAYMIPEYISNAKEKKNHKLNVEQNASNLFKKWGSSLETAKHDEKSLFLVLYYIAQRKNPKDKQSFFDNEYICADLAIASCCVICNHTNDLSIYDKLNIALHSYYHINSDSLHDMIINRVKYYKQFFKESYTKNRYISKVYPIIFYDSYYKTYVEYTDNSPPVPLDYSVTTALENEGQIIMQELIGLIDSEFGCDSFSQ